MITEALALQARQDIFSFVREVREILRQIIREPYGEGGLLIIEDMVPHLNEAWAEFDGDFQLGRTEQLVFSTSAERLQSHGLYGSQLQAKLSLFRVRLSRFLDTRAKKSLLWLLDAIDTVLNSIISATGLDEALKELKEVLRNSINEN